jgi:phage-related protein
MDHKPLLIGLAIALAVVAAALIGIPVAIAGLIIAIGLLAAHWETIKAKTIEIWTAIDDFLNGTLGDLVAVFQADLNLITTDLENAFQIIKDIVEIVMAIIRGDWAEAWTQIKELGEHIWEAIVEGVKARLELLMAQFQLIFDLITLLVVAAFDGLVAYFEWYLTLLVNTTTTIAQGIIDWFKDLPLRITSAIGDLYGVLYEFAKYAVSGFIQGIKDKATDLANAVGDAIEGALNKGRSILGLDSPSREFREMGLMSIAGLREGLKAGLPDLTLAVDQVVRAGMLDPGRALAPQMAAVGPTAPVGGANNTITVNIYGDADGHDVARELDRYMRR